MCRNIKKLRNPEHPPTDAELHDAALQFVRKISGYHKPSRANEKAFDRAVRDVAKAGRKLFDALEVPHHHHGHDHDGHTHRGGAAHHHHEAA